MTVDELLKLMTGLWPKSCTPPWIQAWASQYRTVLGKHAGGALAMAWRGTMEHWGWPRPPTPADIAKHLPDSARGPEGKSGKEQPLPFGSQHFEVNRALKRTLMDRWEVENREALRPMGDAAMYARSIAADLAAEAAIVLMKNGHREAPGDAHIRLTAEQWDTAKARYRSQEQFRATGPDRIGDVIRRHQSRQRQAAE